MTTLPLPSIPTPAPALNGLHTHAQAALSASTAPGQADPRTPATGAAAGAPGEHERGDRAGVRGGTRRGASW